jgi:hypothetical protein
MGKLALRIPPRQSTAEIYDALDGVPLTPEDQWNAATAAMPTIRLVSDDYASPPPDLSPDPISSAAFCLWMRLEKQSRPMRVLEAGRAAAGGYV